MCECVTKWHSQSHLTRPLSDNFRGFYETFQCFSSTGQRLRAASAYYSHVCLVFEIKCYAVCSIIDFISFVCLSVCMSLPPLTQKCKMIQHSNLWMLPMYRVTGTQILRKGRISHQFAGTTKQNTDQIMYRLSSCLQGITWSGSPTFIM